MSAKNDQNSEEKHEKEVKEEPPEAKTQVEVVDEKPEDVVADSKSETIENGKGHEVDEQNLKMMENLYVEGEEVQPLEIHEERLTDIPEESEDGEVEKKSNFSLEEIKDNVSTDSFEEIDSNGEKIKKIGELESGKQVADNQNKEQYSEEVENNGPQNIPEILAPKQSKPENVVNKSQENGEDQSDLVESSHRKTPEPIKIPETPPVEPVTPQNTPTADKFSDAPPIIQVSEIIPAATAAIAALTETSNNDEGNESDNESDSEDIKDNKIDKFGNQRNSLRQMKVRFLF
uniref:Uncharacterized protein n=1 Tax=Panagrolaimus sp. JU765 TaxID=591449 RepID=A0AC34PZN0_9BILA